MTDQQTLKILVLCPEIAQTAGSAAADSPAVAVSAAIRAMGHDIRIMAPSYSWADGERRPPHARQQIAEVTDEVTSESIRVLAGSLGSGPAETPALSLEGRSWMDRFAGQPQLYAGGPFESFARAALQVCRALDWQPDVIHCQESPTAIVPYLLSTAPRDDPFFAHTATTLTIQNLETLGIPAHRATQPGESFAGPLRPQQWMTQRPGIEADLLHEGLRHADVICTSSEAAIDALLAPAPGRRLDPVFNQREERLFAVPNGIEPALYNPLTDEHITAPFGPETLERRAENKAALQHRVGLPEGLDTPLISTLSRLMDVTGLDMIGEIVEPMMRQTDCHVVIAGTGTSRYDDLMDHFARRFPDQLAFLPTYPQHLERLLYAGSDIFLMPCRHEPPERNHLIAMRYGCAPIVHGSGGMSDAVPSYSPELGQGRGFPFRPYDVMALYTAIVRAFETRRHHNVWRRLMLRCMTADFSWHRSAQQYLDLYHRALAFRRLEPTD